jgi:hypothetical protein
MQLQRFEYNIVLGQREKLHDRFVFPFEFDLSVDRPSEEEYLVEYGGRTVTVAAADVQEIRVGDQPAAFWVLPPFRGIRDNLTLKYRMSRLLLNRATDRGSWFWLERPGHDPWRLVWNCHKPPHIKRSRIEQRVSRFAVVLCDELCTVLAQSGA